MLGGAAAVLTGLVFVALSLNLSVLLRDVMHRARSIGTLTNFGGIFIVCAVVDLDGVRTATGPHREHVAGGDAAGAAGRQDARRRLGRGAAGEASEAEDRGQDVGGRTRRAEHVGALPRVSAGPRQLELRGVHSWVAARPDKWTLYARGRVVTDLG